MRKKKKLTDFCQLSQEPTVEGKSIIHFLFFGFIPHLIYKLLIAAISISQDGKTEDNVESKIKFT